MKGKDADKPVVHLHWLVRLTEVGRLPSLVRIECVMAQLTQQPFSRWSFM